MDKVNQKIVECLKKEGMSSQSRLMTYSFAREGQSTFRRRLYDLEEKGIINIQKLKWRRWGVTINQKVYKD